MYYSGSDGSLYADGVRVARVANWSLTSSVEALKVTNLGDDAQRLTPGLKSASGSCTLFYHDDDPAPILSRVVKRGRATDDEIMALSLRFGDKRIDLDALFTQTTVACNVGSVMQVAAQFSSTGDYGDLEL
jgi:hypothetical protein